MDGEVPLGNTAVRRCLLRVYYDAVVGDFSPLVRIELTVSLLPVLSRTIGRGYL